MKEGQDFQPLVPPKGLKVCDRDLKILEQGDGPFKPFTWDDLVDIVGTNNLERLSRRPSDLLHYLACKQHYQEEYGGTLNYIIQEKLNWERDAEGKVVPNNAEYLADSSDVKIMYNDFPYGVEKGIIHVVVWSKAKIPQDSDGHIDQAARDKIGQYVKKTFEDYLGLRHDQVLWFKNWSALQSIGALEHFHVFLDNPPPEKLQSLIGTCGGLPL